MMDAFVMSAGTGGTISGVGRYLKERSDDRVRVVLVDPPGSVLCNKVRHGVAYAPHQRERLMRRHRYDTLAEGIGLDRITSNFSAGYETGNFDDAISVLDQEAVDMAHWLLREEGMFVGSSSAFNVSGAVRVARRMMTEGKREGGRGGGRGSRRRVVTVICDGGQRHVTRFWNRDFIRGQGLIWPADDRARRSPDCLR